MFTTKNIDVNSFYTKGYAIAEISQSWATRIESALKKQAWVEVVPDELDANGEIDKYYECRYMAAASMLQPDRPDKVFRAYMNAFMKWASPVLKKFDKGDEYQVSAFCGKEGYFMEAHSDVGDRSVLDIIAYFGEDIGNEEDGGCLDFFKVDIREPENPEKMKFLQRVVPKRGMVVVFNNMNPSVFHEATKMTRPGACRYQLIAQAAMLDKPEWDIEFEAKPGFYSYKKKAVLGQPETVLEVLANGTVIR